MRALILLVALLANVQPALALDQAKLLKSMQSVVTIRGYDNKGGLAFGSGVVVAPNKVITNCHILRTTKQPWISKGEDSYAIASVQADRWRDFCLIQATNLPLQPSPIGSVSNLKRSQEIFSIGHSNGTPKPLMSRGAVKAMYEFYGGKIIRSSAKFLMGASGSGIFDLEGNLLGINTFKTPGRPAYFYSLPIDWLADIEKQPVETQFPITGKAFWEDDDINKPFFMQIAMPEINQDWEKLMQVAQQWLVNEPKNSDAWYELGIAHENLQQLNEAKAAYQQSISLDQSNVDSLFRLGVLAQSVGDKTSMHAMQIAITKINPALADEYSQLLGCDKAC